MKAEIIAVGTELLLGQVVNTNATFLSEELASLGIEVYYHTVVGDNPIRLEGMLGEAEKRSDLVVLCGGLGPTDDDLTKDVVAKHVRHNLVQNQQALEKLNQFFTFSKRKMTENNLRQTLIIEGGMPIQNPSGLAAGTLITEGNTSYLLLPGPPSELKPMFNQNVRPLLEKLFPQQEKLVSKVLRFYGIGESQLVTELKELMDEQTNPTIAPYAKPNEVTLRLTVKVSGSEKGKALLAEVESQIMDKVGMYFYGYGDDNSLAQVIVEQLKQKGKTITAAESLTAGLFQSTLGDIPGVSEVFMGGFVTYSKAMKEQLLRIAPELLAKNGVVSEACAIAMAEQARNLTGADYGVSFTGVAGPDELEENPAGTVWIGVAEKGKPTFAELHHFARDRKYIRHSAVMKGLDLIRRAMESKK